MKSAIPSDLLKSKNDSRLGEKLAPNDPKLRITVPLRQNGVGTSKNLCRRHSAEGSRLTGLISNIRETPISYYVGLKT